MSTYPITIVSCYYRINSKYDPKKYTEWMQHFLSLHCPMVIYTDQESASLIWKIRSDKGLEEKTLILINSLENFFVHRYSDAFKHSHSIDIERDIHTPKLYMVWNEKTFFVNDAVQRNPFNSEWFFWTDIGCIRDARVLRYVSNFPNPDKVATIPRDKFVLVAINPFQPKDEDHDEESVIPFLFRNQNADLSCKITNRIQGGFFGGHISQWPMWTSRYIAMLNEFKQTATFLGKDQYVMSSIYLNDPSSFHLVQAFHREPLYNPWFDFLYQFSA